MSFIPHIANTANDIKPFHVMKILAEAKALEAAGKDVIHMEIGEPDFASLACVHQAAFAASEKGLTHYTPSLGLPALRNKLAHFYSEFYQADVNAQQIMVTPGSSSALQLILTAILNPDDKVMLADPTYPCNRQFVNLLHGNVLSINVSHETQYQLNLELIKNNWRDGIKAVMVASPANPTGTIIEQEELINMANFLAKKNCYFIVDEIYQGLVYDRPAESILAHKNLPENTIVINSFSKFFGMTGWRLGWCVAPKHLMNTLDKLAQNLFLAAPTPSQYGALQILETEALQQLEKRRATFQQRRDTLYAAMQNAGFKLPVLPQGAFYLYWDISEFSENSEQFCADLLQQTGVAITPGKDFGKNNSETHVRLAYTTDKTLLEEAVSRIKWFIENNTLKPQHKQKKPSEDRLK